MDLRCIQVRKELWGIFEDVFGIPYEETEIKGRKKFAYGKKGPYKWENQENIMEKPGGQKIRETEAELRKLCMEFCRRVRRAGYMVIWMPEWEETVVR